MPSILYWHFILVLQSVPQFFGSGRNLIRKIQIPFGPYLAAGTCFYCLLHPGGNYILNWYIQQCFWLFQENSNRTMLVQAGKSDDDLLQRTPCSERKKDTLEAFVEPGYIEGIEYYISHQLKFLFSTPF